VNGEDASIGLRLGQITQVAAQTTETTEHLNARDGPRNGEDRPGKEEDEAVKEEDGPGNGEDGPGKGEDGPGKGEDEHFDVVAGQSENGQRLWGPRLLGRVLQKILHIEKAFQLSRRTRAARAANQ
jgi:hypothetical protein